MKKVIFKRLELRMRRFCLPDTGKTEYRIIGNDEIFDNDNRQAERGQSSPKKNCCSNISENETETGDI